MAFMQRQITDEMDWLMVDGTNGVEYIPLIDTGLSKAQVAAMQEENLTSDGNAFAPIDAFCSCGASGAYSAEVVYGRGCRLSAPGYLDCTPWDVFTLIEECEAHLDEMYPEEEKAEE